MAAVKRPVPEMDGVLDCRGRNTPHAYLHPLSGFLGHFSKASILSGQTSKYTEDAERELESGPFVADSSVLPHHKDTSGEDSGNQGHGVTTNRIGN